MPNVLIFTKWWICYNLIILCNITLREVISKNTYIILFR